MKGQAVEHRNQYCILAMMDIHAQNMYKCMMSQL